MSAHVQAQHDIPQCMKSTLVSLKQSKALSWWVTPHTDNGERTSLAWGQQATVTVETQTRHLCIEIKNVKTYTVSYINLLESTYLIRVPNEESLFSRRDVHIHNKRVARIYNTFTVPTKQHLEVYKVIITIYNCRTHACMHRQVTSLIFVLGTQDNILWYTVLATLSHIHNTVTHTQHCTCIHVVYMHTWLVVWPPNPITLLSFMIGSGSRPCRLTDHFYFLDDNNKINKPWM